MNLESGNKSRIIGLLSHYKSLTAKQIHMRLQREFAIPSSYQATHKTLKQMLEEKIIIKKENSYCINPDWVENLKKSAESLAEKMKSENKEIKLEDMQDGESVHVSFNGILEVGWFLIDKLMKAPNPDKKPCLALTRFCYSVVGLEEKHLKGLKESLAKNNWIWLAEEDNDVDHMFGETLIAYGVNEVRYGIKCSTPLSDKMIIGDYIAELIYPSNFRKIWGIQNRLPRKIAEFNLGRHLVNMRELAPAIEVIVTKNRGLAEEYREEYL